jgi:hypothetical protein
MGGEDARAVLRVDPRGIACVEIGVSRFSRPANNDGCASKTASAARTSSSTTPSTATAAARATGARRTGIGPRIGAGSPAKEGADPRTTWWPRRLARTCRRCVIAPFPLHHATLVPQRTPVRIVALPKGPDKGRSSFVPKRFQVGPCAPAALWVRRVRLDCRQHGLCGSGDGIKLVWLEPINEQAPHGGDVARGSCLDLGAPLLRQVDERSSPI